MQVLLNISFIESDSESEVLDSELKTREWIPVSNGSSLYLKTFRPSISGFELSGIIEMEVKEAGHKAGMEEVSYVYAPIANPVSFGIVKPMEN